MQLNPLQGKALDAYRIGALDPRRITIYDGAVRSGKTITSELEFIRFVKHGPPGPLAAVGKTERTLYRNVIAPLEEFLRPRGGFHYNQGNGEVHTLGRTIYVYGANDRTAEEKIRGVTLAGLYGDELTLWPESMFKMSLSRLSIPGARLIGTTNPDAPAHWLNRGFLERANELNLRRHQFTLHDNPNLDKDYIADLEREYTGLWRERFILGKWVAAEGAVYGMLDPARHLVDALPWEDAAGKLIPAKAALTTTWLAADYGTTNPTVFGALTAYEEVLYLHHEWRWDATARNRAMTDAELSKAFLGWAEYQVKLPVKRIFPDPSAASFIEQLRRDGVRHTALLEPAEKIVLDGIREVSSLLSLEKLKLHRPTTAVRPQSAPEEQLTTWDELSSYAWDPKEADKGEDVPIKQNDHGPDMLRYAVMGARYAWRRWIKTRPEEAT